MVDVLIVGLGIAGISLTESLRQKGYTYHVISDDSQQATRVAGGLYNPVIFKRYTLAWQAPDQAKYFTLFYEQLEQRLQVQLRYETPVLRLMANQAEPAVWMQKAQQPGCAPYMAAEIEHHLFPGIQAPYGYGKVYHSGYIDTQTLLQAYTNELLSLDRLQYARFDYGALEKKPEGWHYAGIQARHVVFCEGYGLLQNPFFNYLPLIGSKGEVLLVDAPTQLSHVVSGPVFMMPNRQYFRVGSTYQSDFTDARPTPEGKAHLLNQLSKFFDRTVDVRQHWAAIRPTVTDRRPLLGAHPYEPKLWVYNGLGTRGILLAPALAQHLVAHMFNSQPLDPELSIARFDPSNSDRSVQKN